MVGKMEPAGAKFPRRIDPEKFYCVKEVAGILGVTKKVIYRLIVEGDLRAYKIGRYWRIQGADIIEYLENNRSI